ncbi:hypothetical protein LTS09_009298 [Friedmanniomyces endolithicus]|nr:hypothetical protein LTS09_009298 [Friedmanniomyces endolithicus]
MAVDVGDAEAEESVEVSVGVSEVAEAGADPVSMVDTTIEDDTIDVVLVEAEVDEGGVLLAAELLAGGVEEDIGAGPLIDELVEAAVMSVVETELSVLLVDGAVVCAEVRLAVVGMVEETELVLNEVGVASEDEDEEVVAVVEGLPVGVKDADDIPVLAAIELETTDDPDDPLLYPPKR